MNRTHLNLHRYIRVVAAMSLALLFSACINVFQTSYNESSGDNSNNSRYATLTVSSGGISAATIAPDLADLKGQIDSYTLTLTNLQPGTHDPIVINDYLEGTPITGIPVPSDWSLALQGFNEFAELVAEGTPVGGNPIVFPDATPVNVSVTLEPLTAGTGQLDFTLDWSGAVAAGIQVDAVEITLYSFATGQDESLILNEGGALSDAFTNNLVSITANATVNFGTQTLTVTDPSMNSGSYRLNATLLTNGGSVPYAPVIEAVQIYGNLLSSGTINLSAGDLTSPPEAPTDIIVEFTAENTFNLYWTDNSNTEEGFRVYQQGYGLLTDDGANVTSVTVLSVNGFLGTPLETTIQVVAFNQFGESEPAAFTFQVLPEAEFPSFVNSLNTNDPSWAAAGNPGSINWSTMIVGGGSALNLYATPADISDVRALPAPAATPFAPPFNLTGLGALSPLTQYFWRLENEGTGGGRVIYPVDSFTIRDNTIHVSEAGNPANGGSAAEPLDSIQTAIDIAVNGETILVQPGTYNEAVTVNKTGLLLQGSGDDAIISPPINTNSTLSISAPDVTVRDLQVRIGNTGTRGGIAVSGQNATVEDNLITEDPTAGNGTTARGISGGTGAGVQILRNRIVLANTGVDMTSGRFGIDISGSGESFANPLIIDANKISFGDGAAVENRGIMTAGLQLVTNNVIVQEGSQGGPTFIGVWIVGGDPEDPRVIHNTIVNSNSAITSRGLQIQSGTDIVFTNNIVAGIGGTVNTGIQQNGGTVIEANNNLFWNVNSVAGVLGATADVFNTQQAYAAGNVQGDPLLIDTATIESDEWFAPDSLSLIPDGDSAHLALVSNDILGESRSRPTIGAYEAALPLTLVAHWPFDEGVELNDATTYGNVLSHSGDQSAPNYSEDPVDNFYSVLAQNSDGYTVAPSLATSSSSLGQTISFWYRGTGAGNFQQEGTIFWRGRGDGSPVFRIGADNANTMGVEVNGATQLNSLTFAGQMNPGVWNHIVVVFDYIGDEIRVYQDGIFRNVHPVAGPGFVDMTSPGNLYIGRYPNGATQADNAVPGHLDDVRIFNHALETAEVQNLFNAGR